MANIDLDEDFESFLSRVQPRLRKTLAFYSIPPADAETLLKDLFLTLLYKRQSIASPEPWLVNTLRHQCVLYWRRHRWQLYADLDTVLQGSLEGKDRNSQECQKILQELDAVVAELPPSYRNQLRQRYGLSKDSAENLEDSSESSSLGPKELELCLASLGRTFAQLGMLKDDTSSPPS